MAFGTLAKRIAAVGLAGLLGGCVVSSDHPLPGDAGAPVPDLAGSWIPAQPDAEGGTHVFSSSDGEFDALLYLDNMGRYPDADWMALRLVPVALDGRRYLNVQIWATHDTADAEPEPVAQGDWIIVRYTLDGNDMSMAMMDVTAAAAAAQVGLAAKIIGDDPWREVVLKADPKALADWVTGPNGDLLFAEEKPLMRRWPAFETERLDDGLTWRQRAGWQLAAAIEDRAAVDLKHDRAASAAEIYRRVIGIRSALLPPDSLALAPNYMRYADLLRTAGREAEADRAEAMAHAIYSANPETPSLPVPRD